MHSYDAPARSFTPRLRSASLLDNLAFARDVLLPTFWKGLILRKRSAVALVDWLGLEKRAIRRMQHLRSAYGGGPLMLNVLGRRIALILVPQHVQRVLDETPKPFSPAGWAKRSALAHFEPDVSLISSGAERRERRVFNEVVLQSDKRVHDLWPSMSRHVDNSAAELVAESNSQLAWNLFDSCWQRLIRKLVLGPGASDDVDLTRTLSKLRSAANWAFLRARQVSLKQSLHDRLAAHLQRAERGSLVERIASVPHSGRTAATDQVAHWLFAFDAAGIATYRALALLAAHPEAMERARLEDSGIAERSKFLRGVILESLRLWPTTPALLRQSVQDTEWAGGTVPSNVSVLIYAPYFHRDEITIPNANSFAPASHPSGEPACDAIQLVPFSRGPGICPGRNLVLSTTSEMLGALANRADFQLDRGQELSPSEPLPATLNHFALSFRVSKR